MCFIQGPLLRSGKLPRPSYAWLAATCTLFSGCFVSPTGGPGQANLKTCTAPAFPTQLHVSCSADDLSSGDLQSFKSTFDLSNVSITETPSESGTDSSVSGSLSGQASYLLSSGDAQNGVFTGDFTWASFTANGQLLKLKLAAVSGIKMNASIETYDAAPAQVSWNGSESAMTCQASYDFPANGQSQCQNLSVPTAAKVVCENLDFANGPRTLSANLQLSHASIEAYSSGEVKWKMSGVTQGSLTATPAVGMAANTSIESGSLSVELSSNGTANMSWSATLEPNGGAPQGAIEFSELDATGVVPGSVTYNGQIFPAMLCTLGM